MDKTIADNDNINFIVIGFKCDPTKPLVKQNKHIALWKDSNVPNAIVTQENRSIENNVKLWFHPTALIKEIENEESTSVVNQTRKV